MAGWVALLRRSLGCSTVLFPYSLPPTSISNPSTCFAFSLFLFSRFPKLVRHLHFITFGGTYGGIGRDVTRMGRHRRSGMESGAAGARGSSWVHFLEIE